MRIERKTPEEITTLARQDILGEAEVVNDAEGIRCGFMLFVGGFKDIENADDVGALIGYDRLPRTLNGRSMFMQMGFLHKDDIEPLIAEMTRMREALGLPKA